jgi:DNA polymerase
MLDRALEEAGVDRRAIYITNAVKHFKFIRRGTRRIHERPDTDEMKACNFWLDVERVRAAPKLVVLMGATAARTVLGRPVTIGRERGRPFALSPTETGFVTVHPSFLLRLPDEDSRAREYRAFVEDLRAVGRLAVSGND